MHFIRMLYWKSGVGKRTFRGVRSPSYIRVVRNDDGFIVAVSGYHADHSSASMGFARNEILDGDTKPSPQR